MRIANSSRLSAIAKRATPDPDLNELMTRRPPPVPPAEDPAVGEAMMKQNRELMRIGLSKAGIDQALLDKLKVMEEAIPDAGRFLVGSFDLTHRLMVLSVTQLASEAGRIKKDYLDDATLADEVKIEWTRAMIDITDVMIRAYDRTLNGTQAMAKMLGTEKEKTKKPKPGFKPLRVN